MDQAGQAMWNDYLHRKRAERLSEAEKVWEAFERAGGSEASVLAIDFVHVSPSREGAESLQAQLLENYAVELEPTSSDYWLVKGTTRPYGSTLSRTNQSAWVQFMCEVAETHGCVFSTWAIESPAEGIAISSEAFEGGS